MKVNVEIDCTPAEARQFMGLPNVEPMQAAVMEQFQKKMLAEIDRMGREWSAAATVINSGASQQMKAGAIRKVIGRINLAFRPTGRKHRTSELVNVEIVAAERPNGGPR